MSFSTTAYPYDTVVYITDTIGGESFQASGVLISPDEVLTASHVVYTQGIGIASNIVVSPGYNAGSQPFGSASGTTIHYFPIDDAHDTLTTQQSQFDYAVIHLSQSFTGLGYMGFESNFPGGVVNVTGFPASAGGQMINSQQTVTDDPNYTLLDGTALGQGSSGGPVWITGSDGLPYVVGVVSSATPDGNGYFAQITSDAFNLLQSWINQDDGTGGATQVPAAPSVSYTITPNPASTNESAGSLTFTITRSAATTTDTVYLSTVPGQGTSRAYQALNNLAVTLPAGQSSAQVAVNVNDLGLISGSETFQLVLRSAPSSSTTLATASVTILNNDTPVIVSVSGASGDQALIPFNIAARAAAAQAAANAVNSSVAGGQAIQFTISTPSFGSIPAVPSGETGVIIAHAGVNVALPVGYSVFASDATGPSTVTGGSAAGQLVIAAGSLTFNAGGGAGTVMAGGGSNVINLPTGAGNQYVQLGAGNNTVQAGGGQDTIDAGPGANNLILGSGNQYVTSTGVDTVQATGGSVTVNATGGGSDLVFSGQAALFFSGSSNASTVVAGAGSNAGADTVFANGGGGQFYGGSGAMLFVGGSGTSTAVGGAGNNTLFGGSSGRDLLVAGVGASTVVGTDGNTIVGLGTSPDMLVAGTGNETLVGSSGGGNDQMFANSGNDALFGGTGNDTFVASTGTAQMVGGSGQDLFIFVNGAAGGIDTIWNFQQGQDHVALFGYGRGIVRFLLNTASVAGGSTTITLPDNTHITFGNVAQLNSSDLFAG